MLNIYLHNVRRTHAFSKSDRSSLLRSTFSSHPVAWYDKKKKVAILFTTMCRTRISTLTSFKIATSLVLLVVRGILKIRLQQYILLNSSVRWISIFFFLESNATMRTKIRKISIFFGQFFILIAHFHGLLM